MTERKDRPVEPAGVKSAARTLDLLEALAKSQDALTHSDLALRTAIPKSSLTQLIRTLEARHYVESLGAAGPYRIGRAALDLIGHGLDVQYIVACAKGFMEELSTRAGHSCGLNVRNGDFVERVHGVTAPSGLAMHEGVRAPLYASSSGKLVLAALDDQALEDYLARVELRPIARRSLRSVGELRRQVMKVKAEGVAYSQDEFTNGVVGFSAPVRNVHSKMIACLGLAVPTHVFESGKTVLTRLLKDSANEVSSQISSGPRLP
ncbi:MAG: IclR family transcriptional regulator [Burkholderiaceae bacterium]